MSKVVVVDYITEAIIKIPKHIDLEDTSQVKDWWVKWHCLYIEFVDETKETMVIEPYREPELDTKYGCNERITDADDWGVSDDEDEDEDEEEELALTAKTIVGDIINKALTKAHTDLVQPS